MVNWNLAEEAARERSDALSERFTDEEIDRIDLLLDVEATREPFAARLGAAFIRIVTPNPGTADVDYEIEASEALLEGRLSAYLQ